MWPVSQKTTLELVDASKLQVCKANLDNQDIKDTQESMVTLEPLVPQAQPALYVSCMDLQVLQDLQEIQGRGEYQVSPQQKKKNLSLKNVVKIKFI